MLQAIVAIEDDRFYEHGAWTEGHPARHAAQPVVRRRPAGWLQHHPAVREADPDQQGATPEEVKAATAETYERKIAELRYAIAVEKQYSKDEILNRYLNLAYFGDRAYGIDAAAMHYFGVHAAKLTLPQAAMLAGLVKNPTGYNPIDNAGRPRNAATWCCGGCWSSTSSRPSRPRTRSRRR
jgi:membrane peptidoglycan carboxypeptidase